MIVKQSWLARRLNRWASRRHGVQASPVNLLSNRIYILPSRSGMVFALMLLVMLLGSMNYNNSMGLGLAFFLGSITLVTMHQCHRNLLGLKVSYAQPEPVFAGSYATIDLTLHNTLQESRSDLVAQIGSGTSLAVNIEARRNQALKLTAPMERRGHRELPRLSIRTRFPAGLFRAWTWVYWDAKVLVYPKPYGSQPLPGQDSGQQSGSKARTKGEDEFAELRGYQRGDPLNRVAWKQFARSGELHSKTFDDPTSVELWLDWSLVDSSDAEDRLSQLCAWILTAHEQHISYGLRLPGVNIPPDNSEAHRTNCLDQLAFF